MNSATGEIAPPGPVPSDEDERLGGLDVLRGLAVLGILVPNIMGFGQPLEATFMPGFFRVDPGPWSDDLWAIQFVLVDGKMRGLFALLFGAGRTAFTNYIGTSAVMMIVFHGWGLGLFGTLGRIELYGVAALTWAGMLAWPQWWLARYRFGPLEWLWRCLTYGRLFPLREQNAR